MWRSSLVAKLVNIQNLANDWFHGRYTELAHRVCKPTNATGGHNVV